MDDSPKDPKTAGLQPNVRTGAAMTAHAHPVISAVLVAITCSVIIGNAIVEERSQNPAFPANKPRPTQEEVQRHAMMIGCWAGESAIEAGGQRRVLLRRFADGRRYAMRRVADPISETGLQASICRSQN